MQLTQEILPVVKQMVLDAVELAIIKHENGKNLQQIQQEIIATIEGTYHGK